MFSKITYLFAIFFCLLLLSAVSLADTVEVALSPEIRGELFAAVTGKTGLLEEKLRRAISKVAIEPEFLVIEVDYGKISQLIAGRFAGIVIRMKGPVISGLRIEKATFVFRNITLDIEALWNREQLIPKFGGSAGLEGLILEDDINRFLLAKSDKTGVMNPRIEFLKGKLSLSGKIRTGFLGVPVTVNVSSIGSLALRENGERIDYVPSNVKVNKAPLPGFIRKKVVQAINPVLDLTKLPFRTSLQRVEIADGCIILVADDRDAPVGVIIKLPETPERK